MTPPLAALRQDNTHGLVSHRPGEDGVLRRIASSDAEFDDLLALEAATNDRLLGEANTLPGIGVHELLFGVSHARIVNAAFTYTHPTGSRFNSPGRGAWYAAFDLRTAQAEVAYHRAMELREIQWRERENFTFVDYLADFRADFHDLRGEPHDSRWLDPESYTRSQSLARQLLADGSAGIVYPSVRRSAGTCLACFRPALVTNVREGSTWTLTFKDGFSPPVFSSKGAR